jgi:tetratricopeptide (TPR) repeat protein
MGKEKRTYLILGIILLVAFFSKILYINQLSGSIFAVPYSLDELHYINWAKRISQGEFVGKNVFFGLPVYPYFLAVVYRFLGTGIWITRLVQVLLGTFSCFFVFLLGKKVFSAKTGLLSAFIFSIYGVLTFYEGYILSVTLAVFLYLLTLIVLLKAFELEKWNWFLLSGILLGVSGITMSGILLFPFLVIPAVFFFVRSTGKRMLMAVLFAAGVMMPVSMCTVHNYLAERDIVPVTAHSGITFYTGNNEQARPFFTPIAGLDAYDTRSYYKGAKDIAEASVGRDLMPSQVSSYWAGKALDFIRDNPLEYSKLLLRKLVYFINSAEIHDVAVTYKLMRSHTPVLFFLPLGLFFVMPFALSGIIFAFKWREKNYLLISFVASYAAANILFLINARYRLPVVPVLMVFAAYSLLHMAGRIRENPKKVFLFSGILIFLFALTNLPIEKPSFDQTTVLSKEGIGLMQQKKYREAEITWKKLIDIDRYNFQAYVSLARTYMLTGNREKAVDVLEQALSMDPDIPEAHDLLGVIYTDQNNFGKAISEFRKAIDLMPNDANIRYNLGFAYLRAGQTDRGIENIQKALDISEKPNYYNTLGLAYIVKGEKQKAISAWREALSLDAEYAPARRNIQKYE